MSRYVVMCGQSRGVGFMSPVRPFVLYLIFVFCLWMLKCVVYRLRNFRNFWPRVLIDKGAAARVNLSMHLILCVVLLYCMCSRFIVWFMGWDGD